MSIKEEYNAILREAFEAALEILGDSGKSAILYDLEGHGAYSKDNIKYLSLWKIGEGLQELFNQEIAELLMERTMINMDRLFTVKQVGR